MAETGVLGPDERVELIDGEIIAMPPQNLPHANATLGTTMTMTVRFSDTHLIRCQLPITLADDCEPEPDFALVTPEHQRDCNARGIHPDRPDLIVEISDRSLGYDRVDKAALYARAGIPEYWIVNVSRRCLEERRDPGPDPDSSTGFSYRSLRLLPEHELATPLFAPDRSIPVRDLLGPAI